MFSFKRANKVCFVNMLIFNFFVLYRYCRIYKSERGELQRYFTILLVILKNTTLQRNTTFICVFASLGLSPRKELLRALLAGDEEKAIQVYMLVTNGKSLQEDMYPSLPLEDNAQTPMHLVLLLLFNAFDSCDLWSELCRLP